MNRLYLTLVIIAFHFLTLGCGRENSSQKGEATRSITNGKPFSVEQFPQSVNLLITRAKGLANCSGTIISRHVVLTAAHCTDGYRAAEIEGGIPAFVGKKSVAMHAHPRWNTGKGGGDMALLVFPPNSFDKYYRVFLDPNEIRAGREVLLIGWGKTNDADSRSGQKPTYGRNVLTDRKQETIEVMGVSSGAGTGVSSALSNGDSGGGLHLEDKNNAVIGVSSYKFNSGGGIRRASSRYGSGWTNLTFPEHADWLRSMANNGIEIAGINFDQDGTGTPTAAALDAAKYAAYLYKVVLDRAPDQAGLEYWVARLNEGTNPCVIAEGFVKSAQHREQQAKQIYSDLFGGDLQGEGLEYWKQALLTMGRNAFLRDVLLHPDYYRTTARTMPGANDNEKFVQGLFYHLAGYRMGDPSTRTTIRALADLLTRGQKTRSQTVVEFLQRPDYIAYRVNLMFLKYLERANQAGSEPFISAFNANDEFGVAKIILCSDEAKAISQR